MAIRPRQPGSNPVERILHRVAAGAIEPAEAARLLDRTQRNLGFARVDLERPRRCGMPEVIYCPGKTPAQIIRIMKTLHAAGQDVLATRAESALFRQVHRSVPRSVYHEHARAITLDAGKRRKPTGLVAVVSAGTADIPVAEEAALTAERMGARVERLFDAGVAGLHRLVKHVDLLRKARAVVVVAGMEGALPSVVGGMVNWPVIAVPTSVGYGASFGGIAALLGMLNSCASGVTVVNIDNGFGAAYAASLINSKD